MKHIYVALGFLFFGLGAVGAFLPILPTTPFLLLASFFFAKGSQRFNDWFVSTKLYEDHLEAFLLTRSMTRKAKLSICSIASLAYIVSFIFCPVLIGRIAIILVALFMYYYFIFRIKTVSAEEKTQLVEDALSTRSVSEPTTFKDAAEDVRIHHEEMFEEAFCAPQKQTAEITSNKND